MPLLRQIALNANTGAFVTIVALSATSRYSSMEDEASTVQGLQVKGPLDGFVTTNTFSFGSEPVQVPDFVAWDHFRKLFGLLAQGAVGAFNYVAASTLLMARSNGGSGTTLRFVEYE
jgi:hypothetical protein